MKTTTRTTTWTRTELLRLHMRLAAQRLAVDPDRLLRVLGTGLDRQLVCRLTFIGRDAHNRCHARLSLTVDWDEHRRQNAVHARLIAPGCDEAPAPELSEIIRTFERIAAERSLRVRAEVGLCSGVDVAAACTLLGLTLSRPVAWAGATARAALPVKRLPELEVQLDLADAEV